MRVLRVAAAAILVAAPASAAHAQGTRLGDIAPYLMERMAEVALARSAAPPGLGDAAAVWVLTRDGYVAAEEGTNGFVCFVGRGWSGPLLVGPDRDRLHPDVLDTELRAPHCFNPGAARTILPWHVARTRALLDGVAAEDVDAALLEQLADGLLSRPEPGAMAYMTSPHQDLGPAFGPWRPHVMIYLPYLYNSDWGIDGFTHDFPFVAEAGTPWAVAVVPMRRFSDGSEAPAEVTGRR